MSDDFDKYLAIANHDIQRANDYGQLKSYVASILYDYDKKVELLQQKDKELEARKQLINKQDKELWALEHTIKEAREYIEEHTTYERYGYIDELQLIDLDFSIKDLKQILDKDAN